MRISDWSSDVCSSDLSEGTLIVGEGIQVKGEIQSCTTLIVEGKVEASLEAVELAVRDSGHYAGTALVDTARIAGSFSGELTVSGLLTVAAGGRVPGTLLYGELRVAQGGRGSGGIAAGRAAGKERVCVEVQNAGGDVFIKQT